MLTCGRLGRPRAMTTARQLAITFAPKPRLCRTPAVFAKFDTGEDALAHADCELHPAKRRRIAILAGGGRLAAAEYLNHPEEVISRTFGAEEATLVMHTLKLVQVQRSARDALGDEAEGPLNAEQIERIRKCCWPSRATCASFAAPGLAHDHLALLRHTKQPCPRSLARESMQFRAACTTAWASAIGREVEDLSLPLPGCPMSYKGIAKSLQEKRLNERHLEQVRRNWLRPRTPWA